MLQLIYINVDSTYTVQSMLNYLRLWQPTPSPQFLEQGKFQRHTTCWQATWRQLNDRCMRVSCTSTTLSCLRLVDLTHVHGNELLLRAWNAWLISWLLKNVSRDASSKSDCLPSFLVHGCIKYQRVSWYTQKSGIQIILNAQFKMYVDTQNKCWSDDVW